MKKTSFVLLVLLLFPYVSFAFEKELKELSATLAESIAKSGKQSVAVVDFLDLRDQVTDGGRLFAEEFTVNLASADKGFKVIERSRLKTILAEYKLASTGIIDEKTAQKLGQIAGVDAIITGTATLLGDSIRVSVKVLAVDTAQVIAAASKTISKTKDNEGIWSLFSVTAEHPQPAGSPVVLPTTTAKTQTRNFVFEVQRCQREGSRVVCDLIVTCTDSTAKSLTIVDGGLRYNSNLNLIPPTKATDNFHQEYLAIMAQLGDQRISIKGGGVASGSMSPRNPVVASCVFENIAPEATVFSLLEIGCMTLENQTLVNFLVQLHNIPIAKDELQGK